MVKVATSVLAAALLVAPAVARHHWYPENTDVSSRGLPEFDDLEDVFGREFDDEFELDARDPFFHHIKGFLHRMRHGGGGGHHHHHHGGMGMSQSAPVAPPTDAQPQPDPSQQAPSRRDLEDLEFYGRDFDDEFELEARDPFFHHIKGFLHRMRHGGGHHHHHHGGMGMSQSAPVAPPTDAQPQPDPSQQAPSRRDLEDLEFYGRDFDDEFELEARDPFFHHIKGFLHRMRHGGGAHHHHHHGGMGMSQSAPVAPPTDAQPQPDPSQQAPSRRELFDEEDLFFARENFDDLD